MRILLVEDSRRLQLAVSTGLRHAGHGVDIAADGKQGLSYARNNDYDVIVLDIMMPEIDGLTVLRTLREEGDDTHVLLLTAKDTVEDRVTGLNRGADDYLIKPFAFDELLARIEALVRRQYGSKSPVIEVSDLQVDTGSKTVKRGDKIINLSAREYALLEYMAFRKEQTVSRIEIEDHLYDETSLPASNAVDRIVCAVRAKIDVPDQPSLIRTRRGMGYVLEEPAS
jgi:DNA-binding response OmpR family regulator